MKMTYYNLTNVSAADNMWGLTSAVNDMSGGWLGLGFLMTFTVIIFISLKDYPMKESFSATAFISAVICLLMRILGLVSDFVMLIYIVVAAIAAIVLIFDK
jgi:hypothetical protein